MSSSRTLFSTVVVGALTLGVLVPAADALGPVGWTQEFGTTANERIDASGVTTTGEIYAGGSTEGALPNETNVGGSSADAVLVKFAKGGNQLWADQFGTSAADSITGLAVLSSGDVVVTGTTGGSLGGTSAGGTDGFVARYTKAGVRKWLTQFGTGAADSATGVAVTAAGVVYVSGTTDGAFGLAVNAAGSDAFLARFIANGQLDWVKQFGNTSTVRGLAVAIGSNELVYIAGDARGALFAHRGTGTADAYIGAFDRKGLLGIVNWFVSAGDDSLTGLTTSSKGDVVAVGTTDGNLQGGNQGQVDAVALRLTKWLTPLWINQVGTSGDDRFTDVVIDAKGATYAVGTTDTSWPGAPAVGGLDALVVPFGLLGADQPARVFGSSDDDAARSISLRKKNDSGGALVLAGDTTGTVFGQVNAGGSDGFVITLAL